MNQDNLQIAIDGPVGSGKSLIASELAKKLGITYIYTGAMYRALAYYCLSQGIDLENHDQVVSVLSSAQIELKPVAIESSYPCSVALNGQDVTTALFTPKIDAGASLVSTYKEVREHMVNLQQNLALGKRVVMEGRDIALRVLPNAPLKIYLTASLAERAKRRQVQFETKGIHKSIEEVLKDTSERDYQDMHRESDPLQKLPDAWELDSTMLSSTQVIEAIIAKLKERKLI